MAGPFTLGEIVSRLGGRVVGDAGLLIRQVGSLEQAGPGQISFFSNSKHSAKLAAHARRGGDPRAREREAHRAAAHRVPTAPYAYFAQGVAALQSRRGCRRRACIRPPWSRTSAKLGKNVSIGAGCVIGDGVTIGDDSCLYPRVVIYPGCAHWESGSSCTPAW